MFEPLTQVHAPAAGLNFHRSLRSPIPPTRSTPFPPNSQILPAASLQILAVSRPPGALPAAAVPSTPYLPSKLATLEPLIHVHSFVAGLYIHRSFRYPAAMPA